MIIETCELAEPFEVPEFHTEGLWQIERLGGQNLRFVFYTQWQGRPAGLVKLVAPRIAVPPAIRMAAREVCLSLADDVTMWREMH